MFEKQKHFSNKDFTCSIGKRDVIYITFRNNSWKRFTTSEKIAVYIGQSGKTLKFDDPMNHRGIILKLKKGSGRPEVAERTRYLQISGKAWPKILEVVQRTAGSYDMPKTEEPTTIKADDRWTIQSAPTPATFEDYLKTLINEAVKEAFMSAESAAYNKGYDDGIKKGYETAKKDKWDVT